MPKNLSMKNILIVSATTFEVEATINYLNNNSKLIYNNNNIFKYKTNTSNIDLLISGIGIMLSAYTIATQTLSKKYEQAIQVGVAGSFKPQLPLGSLVQVTQDQLGDLGLEDNTTFLPLKQVDFWNNNEFPFKKGILYNPIATHFDDLATLPTAHGITVNTVSGNQQTINQRIKLFNPCIETMECSSFFYACLMQQIPFIALRSLSNYVEVRNKNNWQLQLAIHNLNNMLINVLKNNML